MKLPRVLYIKRSYVYFLTSFLLLLILSLIFFSVIFKTFKMITVFGGLMLSIVTAVNYFMIKDLVLIVLNEQYIDIRFKITSNKGLRLRFDEIKEVRRKRSALIFIMHDDQKPLRFKIRLLSRKDRLLFEEYLILNNKIQSENLSV